MNKYGQHVNTKKTPQKEPVLGKKQVKNSAGGYVFAVDHWKQLERFLILGAEGGTYYIGERQLTRENAQDVLTCMKEDGKQVVDITVQISDTGRAPKNDPALFVLAMCAGLGDQETRRYALENLSKVARIGTSLFHFAEYVESFRGWGRGLKSAVSDWYTKMDPSRLSYQMVKYQQRDGWSHRDLLRLAHPSVPEKSPHNKIFNYIVKSGDVKINKKPPGDPLAILWAAQKAKSANVKELVGLIKDYNLPRECIPTEKLKEVKIWEALLPKMPLTAMIRNLGVMTANGTLKPLSKNLQHVEKLTEHDYIRLTRVHPLSILVALKIYAQGHGMKGKLSWRPITQVIDALDTAFYASFDNVEPTGKRILLGCDISGSMFWDTTSVGGTPVTAAEATGALAMAIVRSEKKYHIMGFSDEFIHLGLSPKMRLDGVLHKMVSVGMGGTDCALPMIYASDESLNVDAFIILTDNETWYGRIHPFQALQQYRKQSGINAKLIVVGMTSNGFTIADPDDAGMLDVVGFDLSVPNVIADFIKS